MQFIAFKIDDQSYAIELSSVDRIVLAAATVPLTHAPDMIDGALNVQGNLIPLINLRRVLELPEREIELKDQFIICKIDEKTVVLWVDDVNGAIDLSVEKIKNAQQHLDKMEHLKFAFRDNDETILIYDWAALFRECLIGKVL